MAGMTKILDWNEYLDTARQAVAEGIVLLENRNQVLPFGKGMEIAVFGRMQNHYYKSGTGSGGMVNVSHVTDIIEGLEESGVVTLNKELQVVYEAWEKEHPVNRGMGWGTEPWSQEEMELSDTVAKKAAERSDAALVIIGRTAGEDQDNTDTKGAYRLTDIEEEMLRTVRQHFAKLVVLLNVGGIMDMSFCEEVNPDAVLYVWQGGMVGGHGTADVLCGKVCPSGRLTDTIAYAIEDYPSHANFGDAKRNYYCEDIYVGYRYFETFAPDRVRYPFGYGLSYTKFLMTCTGFEWNAEKRLAEMEVEVVNRGACAGKQVAQVYVGAPQGKLGKPVKVLAAFGKTKVLESGEKETLHLQIPFSVFASYDDSGVTGHRDAFLLEAGTYRFYLGENVRDSQPVKEVEAQELVLEELTQALAPVETFDRMRPDSELRVAYEQVPTALMRAGERRLTELPKDIKYTENVGIQLKDVYQNPALMEDFIAQLSDEELASIIRGEGMGSSLVTPGTASAFGGVSRSLRALGIPAVCCDDGPSGMRLDCGAKAFSLPSGTLLACTFNKELNYRLFAFTGLEMIVNRVECLLGPGMNIHRHPLNGRNFEYFSEDPLVTGVLASEQLRGLKESGVSGTVKHFCGNNQEYHRRDVDSVISERALREIYLKGFELAVQSGYCDSVMTTYGKVNGCYTASSYDLATTILRKQWGFAGIVMTDWWADITESPDGKQNRTDFGALTASQNDLYMVCPSGETNASGDNTLEALAAGQVTRGELQRAAMNICRFILHTQTMERQLGTAADVEIVGRPASEDDFELSEVEYRTVDREITVSLEEPASDMGTNYILAFDVQALGKYEVTLRGSSELGALAQMACTLFYMGSPAFTMTFHGTEGQLCEITKEILLPERFAVMRLYVSAQGLKLKDIRFRLVED
ncbi:MAG: glycoside hydrolase family 3 C-terminal domain-containing protein [Muribaculum sp.]|nr:glycoside hydrolase family 3 C-terminal domain-containing protein [Muribaculum sp.]